MGKVGHGANLVGGVDEVEKIIGALDLYGMDKVLSVVIQEAEEGLRVELSVVYSDVYLVLLGMEGVGDLRIPKMGGAMFQFSELEVCDVSDRGWEGVRLEVRDFGSPKGFECYCKVMNFMRVSRWSGNGWVEVWRLK